MIEKEDVNEQLWLKQIENLGVVPRYFLPPEIERISAQIKRLNLHHFNSFTSGLPSVRFVQQWHEHLSFSLPNFSYLKSFKHDIFLRTPMIPKVSILPDELIETVNLLKLHSDIFKDIAFNYVPTEDIELDEISEFSDVLSEINEQLKQSTLSKPSIIELLVNLPNVIKFLLLTILNSVVLPLTVSLYLQPTITNYLENTNDSQRVKVAHIKKLPQQSSTQTSSKNRFISGDKVRLRAEPSIKSEIIQELSFGQSVYVLDKDKSWTKIAMPQHDGSAIEGWVFTEYTKRFRQ